jgi:hypothetical protein
VIAACGDPFVVQLNEPTHFLEKLHTTSSAPRERSSAKHPLTNSSSNFLQE